MAIEKTAAWSTPRRSSPVRAQLAVENVRTSVPVSLAVAITSPSGLISTARRDEVCAGIMLILPVAISTSWTCPGVRPGKATTFEPRQHKPRGLFAVSYTESFSGGTENAYTCTLLCKAMTILDRERHTRLTGERNSKVITAFCFASSHIMTYGRIVSKLRSEKSTRASALPTLF